MTGVVLTVLPESEKAVEALRYSGYGFFNWSFSLPDLKQDVDPSLFQEDDGTKFFIQSALLQERLETEVFNYGIWEWKDDNGWKAYPSSVSSALDRALEEKMVMETDTYVNVNVHVDVVVYSMGPYFSFCLAYYINCN